MPDRLRRLSDAEELHDHRVPEELANEGNENERNEKREDDGDGVRLDLTLELRSRIRESLHCRTARRLNGRHCF